MRRAIVITALSVEREAVVAHLRDVTEAYHPHGSVYRRGTFDDDSPPWDVLVAEIGPGNEAAAAEAERAIRFHDPEIAMFVGVAGGIKDIGLGDVVAATKVLNYESAKEFDAGLAPRPDPQLSAYPLIERARYEAGESTWRNRIKPRLGPSEALDSGFNEKPKASVYRSSVPTAIVGPIVTGAKVLASTRAAVFSFIREYYGDAVAVEMEGYGFLRSVRMNHPVQGLVVRGISDNLQDKTAAADRVWQSIAAHNAAAFAFQIFAKIAGVATQASSSTSAEGPSERRRSLEAAWRGSIARCVERWQALGVPKQQALDLANDQTVGSPPGDLVPSADRLVRVIVGDLGIGKSLCAERWHQQNIIRALGTPDTPAPVYIEVGTTVTDLEHELDLRTKGFGDWRLSGVSLALDRLERAGPGGAEGLVQAARRLVGAYPTSSVLLTSRYLSVDVREAGTAKQLTEDQALLLISRFAGWRIDSYTLERWPKSLRSSIRRPLFAILVGIDLKEQRPVESQSIRGLIVRLVERALGNDALHDEPLLRQLARRSVDLGYGTVRASDLGGPQAISRLLGSHLVAPRNGTLAFALDVLADWFAAQALAEGEVSIQELSDDLSRLERWRYPLAIAAGLFPHEVVSNILAPLVYRRPAFASQVVDEAMARYAHPDDSDVPDAPPFWECGDKIREAMSAWIIGLGPLAGSIAPLEQNGSILPIRVSSHGARVLAVWAPLQSGLPPVTEISQPLTREERRESQGWCSARPAAVSAWAWSWTLNDLAAALRTIVDRRRLPLLNGPLLEEEVWREAIFLDRRKNGFYPQRLPLAWLRERIKGYGTNIWLSDSGGRFDLELLRTRLATLESSEEEYLISPWPGLDRPQIHGRFSWSGYSPERFLERTRSVVEGALRSYQQLVSEYFPKFADQLPLATLLPVRLVLRFPTLDPTTADDMPGVEWFFEPIPFGQISHVTTSVGSRTFDPIQLLDLLNEQARSLRPNRAWHGTGRLTFGDIRIFETRPATELAYSWLEADLRAVHWVD